jgi:excisionase family DNA binding protein
MLIDINRYIMPENNQSYYIVKEVGQILNLSPITIRRYIKEKKIKGFYKLGKEWRIEKEDLEKFIKEVKNNNK